MFWILAQADPEVVTQSTQWIQIAAFVVTVGAAAIWLKSALVKQRHQELEELADTRGKRIEDLETKLGELRSEMEGLKGQMALLREFKAEEIAEAVASKLRENQVVP